MSRFWILVAHRSGARLFKYTADLLKPLQLIRDIPHPQGRNQNREIESDKPGRVFAHKRTQVRHGLDKRESAHDHDTDSFAEHLAHILNKDRASNQFDQLIIVSDSRLLGRINAKLDRQTLSRVDTVVEKDLGRFDPDQLYEHLKPAIKELLRKVS